MQDVLNTLESMGEVNIKLSMHDSTKSDTGWWFDFHTDGPSVLCPGPSQGKAQEGQFSGYDHFLSNLFNQDVLN